MDNILSKIIAILTAIVVLSIIPTLYVNVFAELCRHEEIRFEVKNFVEQVRTRGEITKKSLEKFENDIVNIAGYKTKISMLVKRESYINMEGEVRKIDILYTEATVNDRVEKEGKFQFEIGDEFLIEVKKCSLNALDVITTKIFKSELFCNDIRYGGIINNENF